jgi:site-specific DNA recombinase
MKKAAIYARVSTEKQEKEKTIESQIEELRRFCEKNGFLIVKEYVDDGWSGETLARPALDQLRDDASKKLFDAVCIHSPDRLARKFIYQGLVIEELKKNGIEVVFLNKQISDTPEDQLLLGIEGLIAEYEKAKILERTRRGRLHKARSGKIVGGIPPLGYTYVKDKGYVINESEADIVRLIFNLYIQLGSVRTVARKLTEIGVKPRRGMAWRTSTLHRILRNETYIGTTYYNKTCGTEPVLRKKYSRKINSSRRLRDKREWIPIKVPAIIDKATFKLAQEMLKRNRRETRKNSEQYLLSGLVICGSCGSNYTGEKSHGYRFYRCNNRHKMFPLHRKCDAKMISGRRLEEAVWNAVTKAVIKPQILISHIACLMKKMKEPIEEIQLEKSRLIKLKKLIEEKKDKIIELYTDGAIDKEKFVSKMKEYEVREEEIESKLRDIEEKLNYALNRPILIKDIIHFCNMAKKKLQNLSLEEKKKFLKLLIDKIIFHSHEGKAIIKGHIPIIKEERSIEEYIKTLNENFAGTMSLMFWSHEHYPNNQLKFELEVRIFS